MPKVQIWRSNIDAARERCSLTADEQAVVAEMLGKQTGTVTLEVERLPPAPGARAPGGP